MNFASDNWSGATEQVAEALSAAAPGLQPAYGGDSLTRAVQAQFSAVFEREVVVAFVGTGSAANGLALSQYMKPGGVVVCHQGSHLVNDECGAPQFLADGAKLVTCPGANGRMGAADVERALLAHDAANSRAGRAVAVSITQLSEAGTVYSLAETAAIATRARAAGAALHMDGARFANALVTLGCSPADMTWRAGVDVVSFGGTKNGCWCAEAVIFFDDKGAGFDFVRARSGHRFSKNRFVAAQFQAYLDNDHWLETARHANAQARRLAEGIARSGAGHLAWPVDGNQVFAVLAKPVAEQLSRAGARFHPWSAGVDTLERTLADDEAVYRLVTGFSTAPEEVDAFLEVLDAQ